MRIKVHELRSFIKKTLRMNSSPIWILPSLDEEMGEFERVSQEENIDLISLIVAFKQGKLSSLSSSTWKNIENTDSVEDLSLDDAKELAEDYGRDIRRIIAAFKNKSKLPAPIILVRQDKTMTCVAGNTRLIVAKALGVKPQVFFINL